MLRLCRLIFFVFLSEMHAKIMKMKIATRRPFISIAHYAMLCVIGWLALGCRAKDSNEAAQEGFQPLFNGQNMDGWVVKGGEGNFYIEDGMIVGETATGHTNSFLATTREYTDFVLELDFKVDPDINTGVQIRSDVHSDSVTVDYVNGKMQTSERTFAPGTVYGYQFEIDPSERAWTGGFYEEGRRGWLQNLENNEAARQAFKQGEWNHLKIRAEGNHFESWINGVPAADAQDDALQSGFIGLQLHSIRNEEDAGKKVYWKDIMIKPL